MRDMAMRYAQDRATSGSCTARYPHVLLGRGSVSNVSWAMTVRQLEGSRLVLSHGGAMYDLHGLGHVEV